MLHEKLLKEAEHLGIRIQEKPMPPTIKGLYENKVIWMSKSLSTSAEKTSILAEEIGHHHKTYGNILDQRILVNRKQELRARQWAYERLVPLSKIVQAHRLRISNRYEFAEFLDVTEEFLTAALKRYQEKYGKFVDYEGYRIYFEPLAATEFFED